jgi:hypothetical protein
MATHITHNADMVDLEVLPDVEIERLTTERMRNATPPWLPRHERAWAKVLSHLLLRPSPIEEADLSTPAELKLATCYMVAHYAYLAGEHTDDHERARYFYTLAIRELEEVQLSLASGSDAVSTQGAYAFMRAKRA